MSKELKYRNKVEKTYNRTVFDINKNLNRADAFKTNTAVNITIIAVIIIRNIREVKDGADNVINIINVEYLIVL
jgi:hypothetical protein